MSSAPSRWRYAPSVLLLMVTVAMLVVASGYKPEARAMPGLAGGALVVLLLLDLLSLTPTRIGTVLTAMLSPERDAVQTPYPRGRQAQALAWIAALVVLSLLTGLLPGIVIYVVASMRFYGKRSWLSSVVTALAVAIFVWALFTQALRIPLYQGWAGTHWSIYAS